MSAISNIGAGERPIHKIARWLNRLIVAATCVFVVGLGFLAITFPTLNYDDHGSHVHQAEDIDKVPAKAGSFIIIDYEGISDAQFQTILERADPYMIDLYSCRDLTAESWARLAEEPLLTVLTVQDIELTPELFNSLARIPRLWSLRISPSGILDDAALKGLGKCTRLTRLELSGKPGFTASGLSQLAALKSVTEFSINFGVEYKGEELPEVIGQMSALRTIRFTYTGITSEAMDQTLAKRPESLWFVSLIYCRRIKGSDVKQWEQQYPRVGFTFAD